jgi:single-stranded DNA-binding protein
MLIASIYGRVGRDPIAHLTKQNKPMCSVSLAVDVGREPCTETFWVTVLAFNAQAEALERHRKGDMLSVTGWLNRSKYQAADGTERDSWTLRADTVHGAKSMPPGTRGRDRSGSSSGNGNRGRGEGAPRHDCREH